MPCIGLAIRMLTLSPVPYLPAPPGNDTGTAVSANIATHVSADFGEEQRKDPNLKLLIFAILVDGTQPDDELIARKVIGQRQHTLAVRCYTEDVLSVVVPEERHSE